jgi:hypothetical protein
LPQLFDYFCRFASDDGGCRTVVRYVWIVGYVGYRPARDVVIGALRRLEYRGYDFAGIALSMATAL